MPTQAQQTFENDVRSTTTIAKNNNTSCSSICCSLPTLEQSQWGQLLLLCLCFTLAFSSVTLVMSEAPLIVVYTGGATDIAPISIAMFEIGKSFVVLPVHRVIAKYGRKAVFIVGGFMGILSSVFGLLGVLYSQPSLILCSTLITGFATGIAYGYRYAAIDVSPSDREFAVTLCLSGGILAAIIGPVGAIKSIYWFETPYVGSYVMNFAFNTALLVTIFFLKIDTAATGTTKSSTTSIRASVSDSRTGKVSIIETKEKQEVEDSNTSFVATTKLIFSNRAFIYGTLMATSVWICMSLPLSLVGLAMSDAGISDDYILASFIVHFLGMFLPGFFSGKLMLAIGYAAVGLLSTLVYAIAGVCNIFVSATDPALWIVGQFLVGVAWNLGFSTSSVMISTCTLPGQVKLGAKIQAYSDFISFLCGGLITISAGFIYDTGSSMMSAIDLDESSAVMDIDGWRKLNYWSFLFIGIMLISIIVMYYDGGGSSSESNEEKPWRHGSSLTSKAPASSSENDNIRRDSLFLGKGSFYDRNVVVLEEDVEEQEE